jgi:predicted DNA-binding transcriptional regulator YafY
MKLRLPDCFVNDHDYLSLLQTAISNKLVVELEYKNNKSEVSKRRVEPIGLVFYAFSWHLIAWCHMREEYRDFKVARIIKVKNTGCSFTIKNHVQLADYLKQLPVEF